jgi:hypothetical protein
MVQHMGNNGSGVPYFLSKVDGKIVKPGEVDTLYYQSDRTITFIKGSSTPLWGDDVYEIAGSGSGRNAQKTFYAMTISEPLIKEVLGCRYFVKGKVEVQPQGKALRTIDFGDGSCDKNATVTINNKVYNLQLR